MASLLMIKGPNPGQRFSLEKDRIILGRNADCDIVIPPPNNTAVSREHAAIVKIDGRYYIEDLKSRNNTYVNNQVVRERTPLQDNDRIRICDYLLSFHASAAAADEEDEVAPDTAFEASVSHHTSSQLLEAQPAEKLKALLDISADLSKTLEQEQLLPKIVDRLLELFKQAERGFVILHDPVTNRLVPKVIKTHRTQDESNAQFSRSIVRKCLETSQALLSNDASNDTRFNLSQSIADFRIRSVMVAPIWTAEGKAVGVIQLDTQQPSRKFNAEDLKMLLGVASQASIALENARLHQERVARERYQAQMELARQVQRSFLPDQAPDVEGYEFYQYYESAYEVGGDYYDFIRVPGGRLVMMLGDVAGKGVAAALLMAKLSADARFCALTETDSGALAGRLNDLLHHSGPADRFVTFIAATLNPADHTVTLVNAGHPAPMLYRHATGTLEPAMSTSQVGLPLGVVADHAYPSCQVKLAPGDCILAFTDGVTEALDLENRQLHLEGVHRALSQGPFTPRGLGERLVQAVRQHAAGRSQHDDITLVCLGRNP